MGKKTRLTRGGCKCIVLAPSLSSRHLLRFAVWCFACPFEGVAKACRQEYVSAVSWGRSSLMGGGGSSCPALRLFPHHSRKPPALSLSHAAHARPNALTLHPLRLACDFRRAYSLRRCSLAAPSLSSAAAALRLPSHTCALRASCGRACAHAPPTLARRRAGNMFSRAR